MVKRGAKKQKAKVVQESPIVEPDEVEMASEVAIVAKENVDPISILSDRFDKFPQSDIINYSSSLANIISNTNEIINNHPKDDYKKKYVDVKEKLVLFKKMKNTDTENLFEDFKIAAEKRDTDSKKYITQLKFQVEVLQQKNKILNEAVNTKYGCDYDNIQKQLNDRRDQEEKFKIEQIKSVLNDKIKEDDKIISQLTEENNSLTKQMAEMKQEFEKKMESASQQFEELIEKHTQERYENQRAVDEMTNQVNDRLAESRRVIAQLQGENEALNSHIVQMAQESKDKVNLFQDGKQKLIDEWILADKEKMDEFEQRILEVKNFYEGQIKKIKQSNEENLLKIHQEFIQAENKLKKINDELLDQKNLEISTIEKQLTDEIEVLEEKHLKDHQDALRSQRVLSQEIQELKSKLDTSDTQVQTKQLYLDLYNSLTSIKINQVSNTKFELLAQSQKNSSKKIQAEIVLKENEVSYTPISIDNCQQVAECVENPVDFPRDDSSIFIMKLIEAIYQ